MSLRRYLAEFLGTFALVFCGTAAIVTNDVSGGAVTHVGIAITFGLIVMAMIYTFGDISGAHINPAVTLAFAIAGRFKKQDILPYISFQLAGAIAASLIVQFLFPDHETIGSTIPAGTELQSFVLEFILSFFLMLVIMHVALGSKEVGILAGIAIGGTVLLEAMFAGPICGASMNPARSIAPAIVSGNLDSLWLYIAAPTLAMLSASCVWMVLKKME